MRRRGWRTAAIGVAVACWVLVVCQSAAAADTALEVELAPRTIGIEDGAQLTVRVLEPAGSPVVDLGELRNLEIVSGPSTKTEFSWVNGVATRAVGYIYVVRGIEVGAGAVGPVTVTIGDLELRAELIELEVIPGSVVPAQRRGRRSMTDFDPFDELFGRRRPARAARVELRQLVSSRSVVLGQPVVATIVLDTTAAAPDAFDWVEPPAYPRWWAQRVEPPERITGEVVEVDGVAYNRFVVARHVLVPLKGGRLELPRVTARVGFRTAGVFGPPQVVERSAAAVAIEVEDRPKPPAGYAGAVGDLRYRASLEPTAIDFGESAVLTIALEGNGNLPLVEAPPVWPSAEQCESYPPEEESETVVDASGVHGRRVWRTTLVPRAAGEIELEPVELTVFDPSSRRYRSHSLGPLRLTVAAPEPTPGPTPPPQGVVAAADDAVPASSSVEPARPTSPWNLVIIALVVGAAVGAMVPWLVGRRRRPPLPPKAAGESPAERARQLQIALERWWLDARAGPRGAALEGEMRSLRRELEAVRFAPGRADHSETVVDLEERLRGLMRRA